jgi:ankyrin repeat protein
LGNIPGADLSYRHDCNRPNQQTGQRKIKTALHVACSKGHTEIVRYILAHGLDSVGIASPELGRDALHYACNRKSNVEVLKLLLSEGGMNVNSVSRNGWLPVHYAVAASRLDMAQYLVEKGANIHSELESGGNVLTMASCSKNEELVKWLLDKGVSPNVQDKQGLTALHRLSRFGDLSMTKLLVEYGNADIQLLDNSGCSIMEEADRNNMSEIATYLWTKGCESTSIKNPDGMGPTAWFRIRHLKLPSARYGCGLAHMGSKLVLFSGLGHDVEYVNHDNENHMPTDVMTSALKDTYLADLNTVEHLSILPSGVTAARPDVSLSSMKCGKFIRLDSDGLGGWSIKCPSNERLFASIVIGTQPFKREEKFGYFEVTVVNGGENRIVTVGLVDENYPMEQKQPGWDKDSYGYHGDDGGCFHNNGSGKAWGERFNLGDVIGCGINYEGSGEVFWTKNGKFLGVSHIGPQAAQYWPAIGVENDGAIFRVNFGKTPFQFSFVVPTLTWTRAPAQDEYGCSMGRLIPLPEVDEILAIPDRLNALSKVWLFNMRTTKWRTHMCIGIRPVVLSGSQHVRLGDAVFVWNTARASREDPSNMQQRSPALYRLDLDYWTWSELLSYNVLADASLDDNLKPIDDEDDDDDDNDSDDEDDIVDQQNRKQVNEVEKDLRKSAASLKKSAQLLVPEEVSGELTSSSSNDGESSNKDGEPEKTKLTPKEAMSVRMHNVVSLLDSEFKDAFIVAMENELVFVSHMKMLKVNPKTFTYSTSELRGTRPRITHHSAIAVGTDIVTFGGWDDRKQQNELFILDTKSELWYKPHISGLLFPRPRNNHACVYFETKNATFAMDPSDDSESSILAKHPSSISSLSKTKQTTKSLTSSTGSFASNTTISTATSSASKVENNKEDEVYRFCVIAMGWNGANTMFDVDFVALDTQKRAEELGSMLDESGVGGASSNVGSAQLAHVDFDVKLEVTGVDGVTTLIGAHKAILWARSDYFRALLTDELLSMSESSSSSSSSSSPIITKLPLESVSVEHAKALLKFLYTDHVNVVSLLDDYRGFVKGAEKYAPNHVQRLVAEYLHTKVYEPEKLNEELGELLESGSYADIKFMVSGVEFKAHKVVLASRSSFFRAMLTGGLKESREEIIDLTDVLQASPEEFGALLKFLYSRSVDYVNISEYILGLFSLATRCDSRRLKTILESLIAFNLDASNVASLLLLAEQLSAHSLKRACIEFIKRDPNVIQYDEPNLKQQVEDVINAK